MSSWVLGVWVKPRTNPSSLLSPLLSPHPHPLWLVPTLSWSRPILTFHMPAASPQQSREWMCVCYEVWPFPAPVIYTLGGGQAAALAQLHLRCCGQGESESRLSLCGWLPLGC